MDLTGKPARPVPDAEVGVRFTDLYTESYARVLRFVARRAADRAEAEDLTAEVFRVAWSRAVEGTGLSVPWLLRTAGAVLADHGRGTTRALHLHQRVALALDLEPAGSSGTGGDDPRGDVVLTTLARLAPHHREVLVLRYWDECSTPEVAAVVGCSTPSVWVRLHRARRAFHDAHGPTGGAR